MKSYKKNITCILITSFFILNSLFGAPVNNIEEYTLENGMKIYLLEDNSDAVVHLEYTCRAGFSSQTQNTCGFFKLYSQLIKSSTQLEFTQVQCNSDSSRYSIDFAPQQGDLILENLSNLFFAPAFTDEQIEAELSKLKQEVTDNSETLSTYINAAIDSRVFSDAPWKNDSGIYPPLFKKTSSKTARNIIQDISNRWYIPQNSALFIYGNINSEKLLVTLKQTFGRFYSNYQTPVEKTLIPVNKQRKYVFHHPDISPDLTQIVVQYTMLNLEECDLLASALNNNASTFKQTVLNIQELNIPGAEYIDVSSAHKRDNSRLIIQTLLQPPENSSSKINSLDQTQDFLNQIYNIPELINSVEIQFAKKQLEYNLTEILSNPTYLMNNLSAYWAFEPYAKMFESEENVNISPLAMSLINQTEKHKLINPQELALKLKSETPFVFVIINSKDFKAHKKEYKAAGFEEINESNASWYVQAMYKEIRDQFKPEDYSYTVRNSSSDNSFYSINNNRIKTMKLPNGINIISKQNLNSTNISLMLSIKGGKFNSANDNGLEEVMLNLLAGIIEKEIEKKQIQGLIIGSPSVSASTNLSTGSILIEFNKEDQLAICEAISNSIIYGEIAPASADKAVSSKQYRKRLENGSAVNQLYAGAIKKLYGKTDFSKIFECEKDVLEKTDYNSILASYPALLDAGRYTAIVTGNFDEDIFPLLENSFSLFSNNNQKLNIPESVSGISKSKNISVKIRHTFLTDIPAEKAGPQPAVLIPTTEFLDPVLYLNNSPAPDTKEAALYNAVLNYLGLELQKNIDKNSRLKGAKASVEFPVSRLNVSTVSIQNVSHIKEADSVYKTSIQNIFNQMNEPLANKSIVQQIQNQWILKQMQDSSTNSGTARLIQKGLELLPDAFVPEYYLKEYNYIMTATPQDFINIMEWFPNKAYVKVYSEDSKE